MRRLSNTMVIACTVLAAGCATPPPRDTARAIKSLEEQAIVVVHEPARSDKQQAMDAYRAFIDVAGDDERRMLAMRGYMRAKTVDGRLDERIATKVGLTGDAIEEMYRVMAIANYEDRFVIPTAHREWSEDAYDMRGSCGFSFGNGCSGGTSEANLFGTPKRAKTPMEVT